MRIINLAIKDLIQIIRDKHSLLFLLIMPVVFTAFMGFALGLGDDSAAETRYRVGWVNPEPSSIVSVALRTAFESVGTIELVDASLDQRQEIEKLVSNEKMAAVVILPVGFQTSVLAGQPAQVEIIIDTGSANGQVMQPVLLRSLERVLSAGEVAGLTYPDELANRVEAFERAWAAWQQPAFSLEIETTTASLSESVNVFENPYNQSSPGMIVMFAVAGLASSSLVLVSERKNGSLQRLLTTSMGRGEIIAGHLLAMFLVVLLQGIILLAAGQLLFGVDYLRNPAAVLLVLAALALWVAALGILIGVMANAEEQANMFSMAAMFVFAALGGTWFPLEITGKTFAAIGRLMPTAWAMTGFQNIVLRGLDLPSVLPAAGILTAYALGFFALAVMRFNQKVAARH